MIYTSYYGNKEATNSGLKRVSISRFTPDWAKVDDSEPLLMPSIELLNAYKNKEIDEAEYTAIYLDGLKTLSPERIAGRLNDCILLCYEPPGEFCHRNLVRAWLNKNGFQTVEFGEGLAKPKNKLPKVSIEEFFSVELLNKNKDKIFVFGDNLEKRGKGGQAIIRDCSNAFGVPTKRKPSMDQDAFFSDLDEEIEEVKKALRELYLLMQGGYEIVFPKAGLGTGLAEMQARSPKAFSIMNEILEQHFYKNIRGQMSLFD